jgi:carboxypeptidase C (cathepsin A)
VVLFQTANIIFLDSPVGAGFSYATTTEAWNSSDSKSAAQNYEFLKNVSLIDDKKNKNKITYFFHFKKDLWICFLNE